jgi:uncharacterized membrane protein YphA (DoxX/SURF4 family)
VSLGRLAGVALGAVFLVAAVAKLARPGWAQEGAASLRVPVRLAAAVPLVELVLGALLVAGVAPPWPALAAAVVLMAFTVVLVRALRRGAGGRCACFGALGRGRITGWSLARNAVLLVLAAVAVSAA